MGRIPTLPAGSPNRPDDGGTSVRLFNSDVSDNASAVDTFTESGFQAQKRRMEEDLVSVMETDRALSAWHQEAVYDPENGLLNRLGRDAQGVTDDFNLLSKTAYLDLSNTLETDAQRELFSNRFQMRSQIIGDKIADHEALEMDQVRRPGLAEASITEAKRAVEMLLDGEKEAGADALDMAVRFMGQSLEGHSDDEKTEARRLLESGIHGEVFKRQLATDPYQARTYLAEHKTYIRPDVYGSLDKVAQNKIDTLEGEALLDAVFRPDADLPAMIAEINASDARESLKENARQRIEDRYEISRAKQIADQNATLQKAEQAAYGAIEQIDAGIPFEDLNEHLMDDLTPEHRTALRTYYIQKVTNQPAPENRALENDLHAKWHEALGGNVTDFLNTPLARHLGAHTRARLDIWVKRQQQLRSDDPRIRSELSRRAPSIRLALNFVDQFVGVSGADQRAKSMQRNHLNKAALDYVYRWHQGNPGQVLAPKELLENLRAVSQLETQDLERTGKHPE